MSSRSTSLTSSRPTLTWDDTSELYMGGDDTLTIPFSIAPGQYLLQIGLYDYITGRRLPASTNAGSFQLPITIQ